MASLFGAKMLFLIRLAWEASEIQFSSVSFDQSCFSRFYLSWARDSVRLGSELGWVGLRMVVRLDSGLVSFLNSGHKDSNRLDSRLRSVCSRPGSARGSVQFAQGPDQLEARLIAPRGSARFARGTDQLETLFIAPRGSARLIIRGSAYVDPWIWIGLGIDSRLGESAQCLAQLSSELGSGLGSGLS